MKLSKSEYMLSLKHPAWLWLKRHKPGVLPEPDPALQARLDQGFVFERQALKLFPGIVHISADGENASADLIQQTKDALANDASAIAQGHFATESLTCIVDVLQSVGDGRFDLFEIKASTKAKSEHFLDLAFQRTVLEDAGLEIRDVYVAHVNRVYRRDGEINENELVSKTHVTDEVSEAVASTRANIETALAIAAEEEIPDLSPRHARMGSYAEWLDIYEKLEGPLAEDSIYKLPSIKAETLGDLLDRGVTNIQELDDLTDLSKSQARYVKALKAGERHIDVVGIRAFLASLTYPLYFLDYETSASLIPHFDGLAPYQQLPFQYSLHIQEAPGSEIEHREYLHQEATNPVPALLQQLQEDLGERGSVIVWYATFEKSRNDEMGELIEQYAEFLDGINDRVVDLMEPFRKGLFVDPMFRGSSSIKKVLPVLVPDLSYGDLGIQEGATASRLWEEVTLEGMHSDRRGEIYRDLRAYCQLDTLAMVRIFEELKRV